MALIRYPGSKAKLAQKIWKHFPDEMREPLWMQAAMWEFREPFFGAGAIGFLLLEALPPKCAVWLNDKDSGIVSLWQAVQGEHEQLIDLVDRFKPSAEYFYEFKEEDGRTDLGILRQGFRKLALHRMSYSGLGVMSGGPLGGKDQSSAYNVECRWNRETIKKEIARLHKLLARFATLRITCGEFTELVETANEQTFIYLDPPYYEKGPQLYKHAMDAEDHAMLAIGLRKTPARWVLSYDDHAEVRRLYQWATIEEIELTYTMARSRGDTRPKNREVVIKPTPTQEAR